MRKPGCIEPVWYFVNGADPQHPRGYILLAPYSDCPAPEGYMREYADTLAAVDRLEKILQRQEYEQLEQEAERDEALLAARMASVRDRLYARMTSSYTDPYEREFIRLYLQLREEKRGKYRQLWLERTAYLWARHNDSGSRPVDSERVNLDKMEIR